MVGYKKLALIAAGALIFVGSEAQAAPMTEGVFASYFSQPQGRWNRGAAFVMRFVHWRAENPEWSVRNISWVEKYSGDGDISQPVMVYDPESGNPNEKIDDRIPTWKRNNIPEPTTALVLGGMMGLMAMRRRMA